MNLKPLVTNYITSITLIHRYSCCECGVDLRGFVELAICSCCCFRDPNSSCCFCSLFMCLLPCLVYECTVYVCKTRDSAVVVY